jgi:hypothetical protein
MSTPRIRNDLQVVPAEEQGIKYYDVSDPRSGVRMRLYDFEWLVAERMDGRRPFDEVASWAKERLGIQPTTDDLEEYARKLRDLGFFDTDVELAPASNGTSPPAAAVGAVHELELDAEPPSEHSSENLDIGRPTERDLKVVPPPPQPEGEGWPLAGPRTTPRDVAAVDEDEVPTLAGQSRPAPSSLPPLAETPASTGRLPTPAPPIQPPASRSNASTFFLVVAVLILAAAAAMYFKFINGTTAKVRVLLAAPREVVQLYEPSAVIKKAEGQTLAFGEAGKVSDVVAPGTEARAGMPLASLEAFAKIEKDLADVRDRLNYYEKVVNAAKARNDEAGVRAAEAKVAEKRKVLSVLDVRAAKVRLVAPGPGTVAQVLVEAGGEVKAGDPVVKLADKRLTAEFELSVAEAAQLKPGAGVAVQAAADSTPPMVARVAKVDGRTITVELADDSGAKAGDPVRLVKARVKDAVQVPLAAVVKREGNDVVYLLSEGAVHEKPVTVAQRTATDALITHGIAAGDQVVTTGAEGLRDGQKAVTE